MLELTLCGVSPRTGLEQPVAASAPRCERAKPGVWPAVGLFGAAGRQGVALWIDTPGIPRA